MDSSSAPTKPRRRARAAPPSTPVPDLTLEIDHPGLGQAQYWARSLPKIGPPSANATKSLEVVSLAPDR
ncbi:protein of unknown function (plasmid) [Candidatus Methylocalor cossyra]|uniref:Uncharacterized protein n=1 Tax=Candidatus Methylocalor cossyra TaxID=3108543 RepID=A0ABP1CCR8_9GAMM